MNKKNMLITIVIAVLLGVGIIWFLVKDNEGAADDLLLSNLALIGSGEGQDIPLNGNDTLFRFESPVADLGRIKVGHKKNVVFRFTNVSSVPVVITKVMTTCECTSAVWDKAPLLPGRQSRIEVTYEAERDGMFFRKLFIYYAGTTVPLEIAVKGMVEE